MAPGAGRVRLRGRASNGNSICAGGLHKIDDADGAREADCRRVFQLCLKQEHPYTKSRGMEVRQPSALSLRRCYSRRKRSTACMSFASLAAGLAPGLPPASPSQN